MVWNSRLSRRSTLIGGALAGAGALVGGTASKAHALPNVDIVVSGVRQALIVKPAGTLSPELTAAIQDVVTYVQKSTGVTLPSLTQAQLDASGTTYSGNARIYVGHVGAEGDPTLSAVVAGLDAEGFAIRTYGNTAAILGRSDLGTRFGVSEFLERFVGVRWLMPTDLGEDVPSLTTLSIPPTSITQEPAFFSRHLGGVPYGPEVAAKSAWLARNRHKDRISFSHALHAIFNPWRYADPDKPATYHPEYFPIRNGQPYLPTFTSETVYEQTGWQPCFTEPSTVDRAVEYALGRFATGVLSISLGVNDSQGFSTTDPNDPSGINSQGHMGKSEVYFAWVNAVASEVAQTYPDRLIGCLAYNATADPPSFALEPNVVPYLTRDRYGWVDSAIETSEKQRQTAWEAVADKIGWYDYMYGTPYVLPRVYPHLLDEVYNYGLNHSTIGTYAEVYPNWGEGPKPWVHLKKLWNPALNVDTLLTEWYQRAVGTAAAPYLAQYYTLFENFWTQTVPSTVWFQSRRTFNYFNFSDPDYLASVPATLIDNATTAMNNVVAQAPAGPRKSRAEKLQKAFDYYKTSAKSYPRTVAAPSTSTAAIAILDQLAPALVAYQERAALQTEFKTDALLYQHLTAPSWLYWSASQFWTIVDYIRNNESSPGPVTTRLANDAANSIHPEIRDYASTVLSVAPSGASLLSNHSFETASGTDGALGWNRWVSSTGTLVRSTLQARNGTASLKASALERGGPHRVVPGINPGLVALRTYVLASGSASSWHGTFQYSVSYRSGTGTTLLTRVSRPVSVSLLAGAWRPIGGLFLAPATVGTTPVEQINLVLTLDGFESDPDFFLDDVFMHQAP